MVNSESGTHEEIVVIEGDGIGGEVVPAAVEVLDAVGDFEFRTARAGDAVQAETGEALPQKTYDTVADADATLSVHDVSTGGLAVTLAELVTADAGADVAVDDHVALFEETAGRAVVETTDPDGVAAAFEDVAPVTRLGTATDSGELALAVGAEKLVADAGRIAELRNVLDEALD